jgi:hypothetical protein
VGNPLIQRHGELSTELAAEVLELGEIRAAITQTRAHAWEEYSQYPVTERREWMTHSVANLTIDAQKMEASIDALRVELYHLQLQITHG